MLIFFICVSLTTVLVYTKECKDPEWVKDAGSTGTGKCTLNEIGYTPAGKEIKLTPVLSPTAKLQKDILEDISDKGTSGSNALEQATNYIGANFEPAENKKTENGFQRLARLAPKLASTFGIFGLAFTLINDKVTPGADEILEATNNAFKDMTKKMNQKFDDFKEYIAQEIIKSEKEYILDEFETLQNKWLNCKSRLADEADLFSCQKEAVSEIRSHFPHFMKFNRERKNDQSLDVDDVKRLESLLDPFRDFVTFSIASVDALGGSYEIGAIRCKPYAKNYFNTYYKHQVEDIEKFIAYAEWAIQQIKNVHTYKEKYHPYCLYNILIYHKVPLHEGFFNTHTVDYRNVTCPFDPTLGKLVVCRVLFAIRFDTSTRPGYNKYCATDSTGELEAYRELLGGRNRKYNEEFEKYVDKYWRTLLLMESWQKALQKAKDKVALSKTVMCNPEAKKKYESEKKKYKNYKWKKEKKTAETKTE